MEEEKTVDKVREFHVAATLKAFFYNILAATAPIISSILILFYFKKGNDLINFLDDGQILLCGVGLCSTAKYLFEENHDLIKKKVDKILSGSTLWLLLFSSVLYASIYAALLLNYQDVSKLFVRIVSALFFSLSLFVVYRSIFLDCSKYPYIDVEEASAKGVQKIVDQLI